MFFVFSVSIDVVFICHYKQLDIIVCVMRIQNCIDECDLFFDK